MMEISFVSVRAGEERGVWTLHTRPALTSACSALQEQMQKTGASAQQSQVQRAIKVCLLLCKEGIQEC